MRWKNLPLALFDTETTGTDPFLGDRVIEIALVMLDVDEQGLPTERRDFSWLIHPGIPIPLASSRVHHITDADIANCPRFEDIADEIHDTFATHLPHAILCAQNLQFDLNMLTMEFHRVGKQWPGSFAEVDTLDIARKHWPNETSYRLGELCKRFGVSLSEAHRATNDAAACGHVFLEMARRQNVPDDLHTLIDWADGIGPLPDDGPLARDAQGTVVFREGPHTGVPILEQPIHLQWILKARHKTTSGWAWKYSEATRNWVSRWLNIRASDRKRSGGKSFGPSNWVVDSCIIPDRRPG